MRLSFVVELIAGLSFIISALFFSNITGAVTGVQSNTHAFGLSFLCVAIASSSLFIWMKRRRE